MAGTAVVVRLFYSAQQIGTCVFSARCLG